MRRIFIVLVLFVSGLGPAMAADDQANPRDVATITRCINGKLGSKAETCIEIVARPCFKNDESRASSSEVTQCERRERLVWDQLLNAAYKQLGERLDGEQRDKLREMQRAWIVSRDRSCNFIYDYFQGTMANPMIATCENQETARRAIFLRSFAEDAQSGR